jgi:hypothetical protein
MSKQASIEDFLGCYTIRQGSDRLFRFEPGYTVVIGRMNASDTLMLNEDGTVSVSFFCPEGYRIGPVTPDARFVFDESTQTLSFQEPVSVLRASAPQTRRYQISLFQDPETRSRFTYGVIIFGDPQDVGAWGADDTTNSLRPTR